jgi:hypothetical protein
VRQDQAGSRPESEVVVLIPRTRNHEREGLVVGRIDHEGWPNLRADTAGSWQILTQ